MPDLDSSIWSKYRDQGVVVIGIHRGEDPVQLTNFIDQTGITFPVVRDNNTLFLWAFPDGVGYPYPKDIVIGKDLTVRSIKASFNVDEMDSLIQTLLAE